jgi:hypothetical protein
MRKKGLDKFIGHYGCSAADRIVAVRPPRNDPSPHWTHVWMAECPACGERHPIKPMWRRATASEHRSKPEFTLSASTRLT